MRRAITLGALIGVGALSLAVAARQQPAGGGQPAEKVVTVEKLKDNLFVLKGGGGNTAVFVGANGVTVVDTKNPGWGQTLLDKIKELTPKPVTTIINTHTHGDHVSGNVEFPATVDIIAQEVTAKNMEQMKPVTGITAPGAAPPENIFKANNGKGLPKRTFKDRMTLGSGAEEIDLYYFGRGHTGGDAWVVFPFQRVMHAADMFPSKSVPIMDASNGGSGVEYPKTLDKAYTTVKNIDTIITGHSNQMTPADLKEYVEFMRDFVAAVQDAKKAGRTAEEVANTWVVPAKYVGYTKPAVDRLKAYVQVIFDESK